MSMRLSLRIGRHTLMGGDPDPNWFSLEPLGPHLTKAEWLSAFRADRMPDLDIHNMRMGEFERLVASGVLVDDVEVEPSGRGAVIVDARVPTASYCRHRYAPRLAPIGDG